MHAGSAKMAKAANLASDSELSMFTPRVFGVKPQKILQSKCRPGGICGGAKKRMRLMHAEHAEVVLMATSASDSDLSMCIRKHTRTKEDSKRNLLICTYRMQPDALRQRRRCRMVATMASAHICRCSYARDCDAKTPPLRAGSQIAQKRRQKPETKRNR